MDNDTGVGVGLRPGQGFRIRCQGLRSEVRVGEWVEQVAFDVVREPAESPPVQAALHLLEPPRVEGRQGMVDPPRSRRAPGEEMSSRRGRWRGRPVSLRGRTFGGG